MTYGSGHVQSLILNGEDVVSFKRDDLHREIARHYANGISQEQQYDLAGRLNSQITFSDHENGYQKQIAKNNAIQQTQQLVKRLYHYDKTGELIGINDTRRGNISYKYDPVGRLLEANSQIGKETFSFDPASNILHRDQDHHAQHHLNNKQDKGYGYNRLVNNVVKEYLDQQYQYDAYGQLIRQKSSQGDLNLEWDVFGRMIKSQNKVYTAEYRYDALGRRIQKMSKHHHTGDEQNTLYGWDGDTLAYESTEHATKHYIYEKDSFAPLIQAIYKEKIRLHDTPVWNDKYVFNKDPLWKKTMSTQGFDEVCFYHCDHLGTPQELSDHKGQIVWKAQYKAWGELVSDKTSKDKSNFFENSEILTNNIRFQGQYFDQETGLHYNRHRYYSPYVGRFISKDPIGLDDGFNIYKYATNPISWIDPYGLKSLYRSMSIEEYNSIKRTGKWTTKPGALDGKWLAESYATAKIWGNTMGHGGCEFMIVQVNMQDKISDQLHKDNMLDGIGAARYATLEQLNNHSKIAWVKKEKAIASQCKFK